VPEALVRRLHKVLAPGSDQSSLPRPEEVSAATLTGRVARVDGKVAYLTYSGRIAGAHLDMFNPKSGKKTHADMRLVGVGAYDVGAGRLISFTLVGDGNYRHFPPYDYSQRYGAVVEWRRWPE
jgi:hypothetical protein